MRGRGEKLISVVCLQFGGTDLLLGVLISLITGSLAKVTAVKPFKKNKKIYTLN